ncbi:MAG: VIT1/CCC1 transporter family protein [Promethearchaeota archaeon]
MIILKDPSPPTIASTFIILTGLGTAISMLISGISGSYLSERAEQKKGRKELDKAMGIFDEEKMKELSLSADEIAIQKAMLRPINREQHSKFKNPFSKKGEKGPKKPKTLHEKAESFSGILVSFVNGFSPFLGGIVPIIPFFLVSEATIFTFISSFIIILVCIILLGCFLGKISQESMIKNILQMALAFFLTMIITVIFLG